MRHWTTAGGIACLAATAALLAGVRPAAAADEVSADQLLPHNTYALISVPDITDLKERFGESSLGRMRDDESLRPFWADVDSALEEAGRQVERQIGIDVDDLLAVPSGEFALAVVPVRAGKIGIIGMLDFGESEETVDQLLEKLADAMEEQGATRKVEEAEDTKIVVYSFVEEGAEGQPQPRGAQNDFKQFAYFIKDQMIVAGNSVPALQDVLKRWDGQSEKTLASSEVYSYVREQTAAGDEEAVLAWYVDPVNLVRSVVALAAQGNPQVGLMFPVVSQALGLSEFKAVGGTLNIAVEGFDTLSKTLLYVGKPTGVLNVFQFPAADLTPPAWVTAEADAYFAANWDVNTAYQAVENLYDNLPLVGQGPGSFAALLDQAAEEEPGIHPKKDVIDLMTGRMTVAAYMSQEADEEEDEEDAGAFVFALGIKDAAKAKALLQKIAKGDAGLETREFQGETIYEVAAPGLQGGQSTVSIAVTRSDILVTNEQTALEQILRGATPADSLAQSPEYKAIAEHFPGRASILTFERQDTQLEAAYEALRSGQVDIDVEQIDFTKLPPFDDIREYLTASGSYAVPDKHGALMVSFTLGDDEQ